MWKRVVKGADERRKVMKLAAAKLLPPSQFRDKLKSGLLCGVLPKIPKSRPDITMFLMQAKFCVKEKSKEFLKVVADPKQQCVLGPSLSADLDRPLFFGEGGDSPNNSNSDDQEETSGSSMLMNDIWSSMTLEAGLRDHLRLAEVTGIKRKNKKNAKIRVKSTNSLAVESTKNLKESCTQTVVEAVKESSESTPIISVKNIKVEADSSDSVCFVGIIRKGCDDLVTGSDKEKEAEVALADNAKEDEIRTESSESPLKQEKPGSECTIPPSTLPPASAEQHDIFFYDRTPSPSQNIFNNGDCDFINGCLPDFDLDSANPDLVNSADIYDMLDMGKPLLQNKNKENFPKEMFQGNDLGQLPLDEEIRNIGLVVSSLPNENVTAASGGKATMASEPASENEQQHHSPVHQEEQQEKIDDMIESFKEQDRYSEKNPESNIVSNNATNVSSEVETKSKDNDSLHSRTLRSDHSIFIAQNQFRSLFITEVIPPIPVPSPSKVGSSRCNCNLCNENCEALETNYKNLTAYKNAKISRANTVKKPKVQEDVVVKAGAEEETEPSKNSRMKPLKKRKAIQNATVVKKEAIETSYPCTPMMSIAVVLEESKIGLPASSTKACSVLDYTTASSAQQYSYSSAVNSLYSSVPQPYANSNNTVGYNTVHTPSQLPYTDNKTITSTNCVVNALQTTFQRKFKTPAQLKEGISMPTSDLNAAQNLSANCVVNALQTTFQRTFKTPAQLKEGISMPMSDLNSAENLINFAQNYCWNTQSTYRKKSKRTRV